jgi:hypothetical protein
MRAALLLLCAGCGENLTAPDHGRYQSSEPEPLPCLPNLDGRIDAAEIQPAIGMAVSYLVSPEGTERPVDVAGEGIDEGRRRWDWSTDLADDEVVTVVPAAIDGKWYAGAFEAGAFVTPFDAAGRVESIGRHDAEGLWLLGLASREESPGEGQTLLVYQEPVLVLRFPIEPGASFTSTGAVENGTLRGLPYAGSDTYEVSADAVGELLLPQVDFTEAHRVRTRVTVQPAVGTPTSRRQVSYYFECFAEVARATSLPDEAEEDFTTAAEVRRLGFEEGTP